MIYSFNDLAKAIPQKWKKEPIVLGVNGAGHGRIERVELVQNSDGKRVIIIGREPMFIPKKP